MVPDHLLAENAASIVSHRCATVAFEGHYHLVFNRYGLESYFDAYCIIACCLTAKLDVFVIYDNREEKNNRNNKSSEVIYKNKLCV